MQAPHRVVAVIEARADRVGKMRDEVAEVVGEARAMPERILIGGHPTVRIVAVLVRPAGWVHDPREPVQGVVLVARLPARAVGE